MSEFVHVERMDGQVYNNIRTAMLKAQTALRTRQPTSINAAQLRNNPAGLPRSTMYYNFFTNSGGLPIVVNGNQFIGAIGVGGSAPMPGVWSDEICAWRALTRVMGPQPPLLPDITPATAAGGLGGRGGRGNGAPNQ